MLKIIYTSKRAAKRSNLTVILHALSTRIILHMPTYQKNERFRLDDTF